MIMGGAVRPTARVAAQDETASIPGLATQIGFGDPLDALVDRVRPVAARSVDGLQVAAALEASGVTDRVARVEFGFDDVFDLASEIHRRVIPADDPPRRRPDRVWAVELRDIGHGAMYLLPAALFPPALAALGRDASVLGIVLAAAIGWVWSGATAWLGYQLLGQHRNRAVAILMRWSLVAVLPVAAVAAVSVTSATGVGYGLVIMATAQVAYQMACTVLVFYHREGLVFASMMPAVAAGVAYVAAGSAILTVAIVVGLLSVASVVGLAVGQTLGRGSPDEPPLADSLRGTLRPFLPVIAFTALSAAFFLWPQARHFLDGYVAVGALPLIMGMGVVEWRARRFGEDARTLLARVSRPRQFGVRVWLLVLGGLGLCLLAVSILAAVLLVVLARAGQLTPATTAMVGASVLLAGAYFLGFVLANKGRYGWLCGSLLLCLGLYLAAGPSMAGVLADTTALLAATAMLVVLYLTALASCVHEAHRHR